jgi:hypothetical protein
MDFWLKAIEKEATNVMPAFKFLEDDERTPIGYHQINCRMVFDIHMSDFTRTREARFVADGHTTDTPAPLTYSSIVSRKA